MRILCSTPGGLGGAPQFRKQAIIYGLEPTYSRQQISSGNVRAAMATKTADVDPEMFANK